MDLVSILQQYWGILVAVLLFISGYIYNRKKAIQIAKQLIIYIEKNAEEYALKDGKDKFQWVTENGYKMLPTVAKIFISEFAFKVIIQYVFDKAIDWAEENNK